MPAHDSADVTLPLEVSWRGLRDVGRAALEGGAVPYRVVGTITADTPVGAHVFPVDAERPGAHRAAPALVPGRL